MSNDLKTARVDGTCAGCGHQVLVASCAQHGCDQEVRLCWGCPDVAEGFVAAEGRCEGCRHLRGQSPQRAADVEAREIQRAGCWPVPRDAGGEGHGVTARRHDDRAAASPSGAQERAPSSPTIGR